MGYALTSVLPMWLRRTVGGAAEQSNHWQAFRQAARATAYYQGTNFVEQRALALAEFYRHHARFLNPAAVTPDPVALEGPWELAVAPKTVALQPWFRLAAPVETRVDCEGIESLTRCDILAAPVRTLIELAGAARLATPAIPGFGILAFTGVSQQPLSAAARDTLWAAWRTPVFEQFRGFQGELLGAECEAFDGLHFDPAKAAWEEATDGTLLITSLLNLRHPAWRLETGRRGRVEHAECRCGSSQPRIIWAGPEI